MRKNDIIETEAKKGNSIVVNDDNVIVSKVTNERDNRLFVKTADGEWMKAEGKFYIKEINHAEVLG